MIETMKAIVGWASVSFSIIGFAETAVGFWEAKSYNLGRAIIYCLLFGIGIALIS